MQFVSLHIQNFRSIQNLELDNLPPLVVLAGPNGSGKSSVFDALRIYKEAHAGYSINNPGTSQIHQLLQQLGPVVRVGQDYATISATIMISDVERRALGLPEEHAGLLTSEVRISQSARLRAAPRAACAER